MNEDEADEGIEEKIEHFEEAFRDDNPVSIESLVDDDSDELVGELCLTELDLRLKQGEAARVEEYTSRFPDMAPETIHRLIRMEFFVRGRDNPGIRLAEYQDRFPDQFSCLHDEVAIRADGFCVDEYTAILGRSMSDRAVAGRYSLEAVHAEGGLGTVWVADDPKIGRKIAIKAVRDDKCTSREMQQRLRREAAVTGRLEHPGIVPVHDLGEFDNGQPFYVMKFVEGKSLRDEILHYHAQARTDAESNLMMRRLLQNFIDVCNTIDYAHTNEVVHRDIKPQNIMIGRFGETLVVDWGLAKNSRIVADEELANDGVPLQFSSELENDVTRVGQVVGSPGYMSPEQQAGDVQSIGPTTDIFGLGATLYTILTDRTPVLCEQLAKVDRQYQPLLAICRKAMETEPSERYPSAKYLAEDVERFLANERVLAHSESLLAKWSRLAKRHSRWLPWMAGGLILLTTISSVAAYWINRERKKADLSAVAAQRERDLSEDAFAGLPNMFHDQATRGVDPDRSFRDTVMAGLDRIETDVKQGKEEYDPVVYSQLLVQFGRLFFGMEDGENATRCEQLSRDIVDSTPGIETRFLVNSRLFSAGLQMRKRNWEEGKRLAKECDLICKADSSLAVHDYRLQSLNLLATCQRKLKEFEASASTARQVIDVAKSIYPPHHVKVLGGRDLYAAALFVSGGESR
ncbi:MAG: serine/threonine-protein kinase, partial [Planctomycetota bacterium]